MPDRWARKTKQRTGGTEGDRKEQIYSRWRHSKNRLGEKLKRKLSEERKKKSSEGCGLTLSSSTGLSGSLRTPRELALFMLRPREPHASTSVRSKARGEGSRRGLWDGNVWVKTC